MNLFKDIKTNEYIMILAEKPSVARSIAKIISTKLNKPQSKGNGYIFIENFYVTWAIGHLLSLANPGEYDKSYDTWDINNHPIIVEDFLLKVPTKKDGTPLKYVSTQLANVISVANVCQHYLIATDYDREGQIIGEEIMTTIPPKPTYRILLNEWTRDGVINGLENAIPNDIGIPLKLKVEGLNRQRIDWLIGMNYTPMFSIAMGRTRDRFLVYNLGRVIMPTLKMLYEQNKLVEETRDVVYLNIIQELLVNNKDKTDLVLKTDNHKVVYNDNLNAQQFKESLLNYQYKVKIDNSITKSYPPLLFSMTTLQKHIIKIIPYLNASKVSDIAQKLYEKGLITYPRTESNHLEKSLFPKVCSIIKSHVSGSHYENTIKPHSSPRVFNDSLVKAHSSITPTARRLTQQDKLTEPESLVYAEILKRFLVQFAPPARDNTVSIRLNFNEDYLSEYYFEGNVNTNVYSGYQAIYTNSPIENLDESKLVIKDITSIKTLNARVDVDKTSRPYQYTESQLLTLMQNCGKNLISEDLDDIDLQSRKDILEGFSLGTSATRGDIVQKMIDVSYIDRVGRTLVITRKGKDVIEYFPNKTLLEPDYAGNIEYEITKKEDFSILEKVKEDIISTTEDFKNMNYRKYIGYCPLCNNPIIIAKKVYGCMHPESKCRYHIPNKIDLISVTVDMAKKLLTKPSIEVDGKVLMYECDSEGNENYSIK